MALAPRPPMTNPDRRKSSAHSAEYKRQQRARNGTRSGSSGAGQKVAGLHMVDFDDIMNDANHITDMTGKISHSQAGSSGMVSVTMQIPLEYAHNALDAHIGSRDGLVYLRVYGVSFEAYLKATGQTEQAEGEDGPFDPFEVV